MLEIINISNIKEIVYTAGDAVLKIYNTHFKVDMKQDGSPVTTADKKSNQVICNALKKQYPNIPIISEENQYIPYKTRKKWDYYWCIDPLDGTKEFIKKNGEFTINIALIYQKEPILGVVFAPDKNILYHAKKHEGSFKNNKKIPLKKHTDIKNTLTVVSSNSHYSNETKDYIKHLNIPHLDSVKLGSSLKLCMVADGTADIYPRLAPTMEWDTAAADAIVRESGKMTYSLSKNANNTFHEFPMTYNKKNFQNPWFVVK